MTVMQLKATVLKADRRRREHLAWETWMRTAAKMANSFYNDAGEDDPFNYGETASVGFLATAAARAGYLALPEFAVKKVSQIDRRKRGRGRSDLWLMTESGQDWWFEFKQHFITRGSDRDLERRWEAAIRCADQIKMHGSAVAGLVASLAWLKQHRPSNLDAAQEALNRFQDQRQFAYRIGARNADPETYIFLEIVD